jgi:predicted metal-binding protein
MDQDTTGRRRGRREAVPSLHVCVTCRWHGMETFGPDGVRPGQHLHDLVKARATPEQNARIQGIVCLAHCLHACNAVAMQRGKTPLLMTQMAPDEATARALLALLDTYGESADGVVSDRDVPQAIPLARPLVPPRGGRRKSMG